MMRATGQKQQKIEPGKDNLKNLEAVLCLAEEERRKDVHHGRPGRKEIAVVHECPHREAVEEEKRALKMLRPVAIPSRAGVHADHTENHQCPDQQERIPEQRLLRTRKDRRGAGQYPSLAMTARTRLIADTCKRSTRGAGTGHKAVVLPRHEVHEDERKPDGTTQFFHWAPAQAADDEKARRESAHRQQKESNQYLESEH